MTAGGEKDFGDALIDGMKNATTAFILKHYPQLFELLSKHNLNTLNFEHGIAVEEDYILAVEVNVHNHFHMTTKILLIRPAPAPQGGTVKLGIKINTRTQGFIKTLANEITNLSEDIYTFFVNVSDSNKQEEYQFNIV